MGTPQQQPFPRRPNSREERWLDLLLPEARVGYRDVRRSLRDLLIIGEGRWGGGDYHLGNADDTIDLTEGMTPVLSYGEVTGADDAGPWRVALSIHSPNEHGTVEFQISPIDRSDIPDEEGELGGWSYANWSPGNPCPATGEEVREVMLDRADQEFILVIDPARRVLWLHERHPGTNQLVPVTNFYNELMLMRRERNPDIALDHGRLFSETASFSDAELRDGFSRYNKLFRKVDPERLGSEPATIPEVETFFSRMAGLMRRKR